MNRSARRDDHRVECNRHGMGSGREKTRPDRGLTERIKSDRWDVGYFTKNTVFRTSATSSSDGAGQSAYRHHIANYVTPARKNVLPAQRSKTLISTQMRGHGGGRRPNDGNSLGNATLLHIESPHCPSVFALRQP
ncbi:hypothetical protein PATSB16_32880 [Pandoraea thiooxydans]|uniref:hypothetical protein n=1 Tax=Pandoraea thiooxydans TaxID=445709 RepID=UPI00094A517B|nr:hypothetical protein [Pandoraea thiooxydans]APR96624.1 hypothetical protein PATSB16_32880 [Pandoraea thiooxydans]